MSSERILMASIALKHIEHLSVTIGPRGSTTAQEKAGHDYAQTVLADLGCNPRAETFQSGASVYLPFIIALALMLVAEAIFYLVGRTANASMGALAALVLGIILSVSIALELTLRDNPLRWFASTAPSQNVIGFSAPSGEVKRRVAVMAHVDSHRTPLFWRNRQTYQGYRLLTTLAIVSLLALDVIFAIGLFAFSAALLPISLVPAAIIAVALVVVIQAHASPYTAGANDNASGVGVMLALAEKMKSEPLANTEVWWVATGCEEVGAYGSADFVRQHGAQFKDGAVLVIDNIGGKDTDPVYLTSEGIALPIKYPAASLAVAQAVTAAHPELRSRPATEEGAYTDAAYALMAGLSTITLLGYTKDNWIPDWHNPTDVLANVDADAVDRTERLAWALLKKLDE